MDTERLKRYGLIPKLLRTFNPTLSYCGICGLPWNHCEPHCVKYDKDKGFFAVCEYCNKKADSVDLAKAYLALYDKWSNGNTNFHDKMQYTKAFVRDINHRRRNG